MLLVLMVMVGMVMRVRERIDVAQIATHHRPRLVGRLGAGRPPARLMVIRHRGHRLLRLLLGGDRDRRRAAAAAPVNGHVDGRL